MHSYCSDAAHRVGELAPGLGALSDYGFGHYVLDCSPNQLPVLKCPFHVCVTSMTHSGCQFMAPYTTLSRRRVAVRHHQESYGRRRQSC